MATARTTGLPHYPGLTGAAAVHTRLYDETLIKAVETLGRQGTMMVTGLSGYAACAPAVITSPASRAMIVFFMVLLLSSKNPARLKRILGIQDAPFSVFSALHGMMNCYTNLSRSACVAPRKTPRSLPTATKVAPISM